MKEIKTICKYALLALILSFTACSKVIIDEMDESEQALYSKIYMPRAERGDITAVVSTSGDEQVFLYNAYLGGPTDAPRDLNVTFAVNEGGAVAYNEAHGTDYELLPSEAFSLEKTAATILSGSRTTGDLRLTLKPGPYLTLFKTYLLPISVNGSDGVPVHEGLSTSYYLVRVTYKPGEVPRQKVLSLGNDWGNILATGARGSVIRRDKQNDIWVYVPNEDGIFTTSPIKVGTNWDASESFYYVNESTVVVRNYPYWAGLFNFDVGEDYALVASPTNFWLGDFWDKYKIIPYQDYFLTVDANGIMRRQPALTSIDYAKTDVGTGFKDYKQLLAYKNYLLALEDDGKLWLFSMSDEGVPGTKIQVGTGWDMYEQILVSGDDILARDVIGDVYRYTFDPNGFYPLKP